MLKFAFIENLPGSSPETCSAVYENAESYSVVVGTSSYEMTEAYVRKLDEEGFSIIDLCGDFDDEAVAKLKSAVKSPIQISHADYLPEELKKIQALESFKEYGIIVAMDGVEETVERSIRNEEGNSYIRFVKDLDAAKAAAVELVGQGVYFIELCSYFDKKKTEEVIAAIEGKVPVGTCGEIA